MNLIRSISSTLKTWVFKKKLLKFSERYRWETQACFYCPEMCRFSCPVAETLRHDGTTPRGKMSLLHMAERGFSAEQVAGSAEQRLWFLEQCTGCGRCTEFCLYENDVATHLRKERQAHFESVGAVTSDGDMGPLLSQLRGLKGKVLFSEPSRKKWWEARPALLSELGVDSVCDAVLPHKRWSWGKVTDAQKREIGAALSGCSQIWVESPEAAWFLAKAIKHEEKALKSDVRVVWQKFFADYVAREPSADETFHESYHLSRLFPQLDYSIPMYERGFMPFHHGWNVIDCGGEGYYAEAHPENARAMSERFLTDLGKDGRKISKIICQSLSCIDHLREVSKAPVTYWLDEMVANETH